MPAAAWPGSVQRNAYFPAFRNVARRMAVLPDVSRLVFLPTILKSWATLPLFATLNVTAPLGTVRFESVNRNSDGLPAVTATVVGGFVTVRVPFMPAAA